MATAPGKPWIDEQSSVETEDIGREPNRPMTRAFVLVHKAAQCRCEIGRLEHSPSLSRTTRPMATTHNRTIAPKGSITSSV